MRGMARYVKIASQLPDALHERYFALEHGHKQLACAAGFLMYFACDSDTQWMYREWARAIAEGRSTVDTPPEALRKLIASKPAPTQTKKRRR